MPGGLGRGFFSTPLKKKPQYETQAGVTMKGGGGPVSKQELEYYEGVLLNYAGVNSRQTKCRESTFLNFVCSFVYIHELET